MKKTMKVAAMLIAIIAMLSFSFTALADAARTKTAIETKASAKSKKKNKNKKNKKVKKFQEVETVIEADASEEIVETIEDEKTPLAGANLSISLKIKNKGTMKLGDTLKIEAKLSGFEGIDYSLQWQKSVNGRDWVDVKGQTGKKLNVVLTAENAACSWRVAAIAA